MLVSPAQARGVQTTRQLRANTGTPTQSRRGQNLKMNSFILRLYEMSREYLGNTQRR